MFERQFLFLTLNRAVTSPFILNSDWGIIFLLLVIITSWTYFLLNGVTIDVKSPRVMWFSWMISKHRPVVHCEQSCRVAVVLSVDAVSSDGLTL